MNDGLFAYYTFDINSKNANNQLRNEVTGTFDAQLVNGATIIQDDTKDRNGILNGKGALCINNSTNNLDQRVDLSLDIFATTGTSICFWVKTAYIGTQYIFNINNSSTILGITLTGNNSSEQFLQVLITISGIVYSINCYIPNNTWTMVVFTMSYAAYNSNNSLWAIYSNGILKTSNANKYYITTPNVSGRIGQTSMLVDDFRVYKKVLSATDVQTLYTLTTYTPPITKYLINGTPLSDMLYYDTTNPNTNIAKFLSLNIDSSANDIINNAVSVRPTVTGYQIGGVDIGNNLFFKYVEITTSQTITIPSWCTKINAILIGGGGGGGGGVGR